MIKASVIIPAHNEEKYIMKTLQSLNNQLIKRNEYEIIVCNDASSDKTSIIAKNYADIVLDLKKCKSIAQVRNNGAKIAKGEILIFVDADTIVSRDFIKKAFNINEVCALPRYISMGQYDISIVNEINNFLVSYFPKISVTSGCCMVVYSKFFNQLGGFNESMKTNEDNEFFRRIFSYNYRIGIIDSKVITSDRRIKQSPMRAIQQVKNYLKFLIYKDSDDYSLIR